MATTAAMNKRTGDSAVGGDDDEEQAAPGKRRRRDGAVGEQKQQPKDEEEAGEEDEVTEDEVEAFFAILRRIKECAPGTAGMGNDRRGRRAQEERNSPAWMWRPTFEWEDFEGASAGGRRRRRSRGNATGEEEAPEDGAPGNFDLNVEPANERATRSRNRGL